MKSLLFNSAMAQSVTQQPPAEVPAEQLFSIWDMAQKGGVLMVPIALLSVVAVYIFVERFLAIRRAANEDLNFMNNIRDFIHNGKIEAALSLCKINISPIARMIEKGVTRIGKPLGDISAAIENVGKLEVYKLENNLATLATIAGAAPMLGFLGTVIGMIQTFHQMYISGNSVELSQLSGGIMMALVTTVAGLVVGIFAYICYNMLVAKMEHVVYKMEARSTEFLDLLQEPVKE